MCIKAVCQPRSVGGLGNPATLRGARGSKSHSAFLALQTPLRGLLLFPVFPQALLIISPLPSSLALLSTGDAAGAGNAFQLYTSASCLQVTHRHNPPACTKAQGKTRDRQLWWVWGESFCAPLCAEGLHIPAHPPAMLQGHRTFN